ncbi:MAG: AMP-binding protein [Gordonia sp. (in: high G+C Gram-positive bacteria)]
MTNLVAALWSVADDTPDRIAVRNGADILTYGQLRAQIAKAATRFADKGVRPGDRVLFIAPSIPDFAIIYYGLHTLGATVVTLNVMSAPGEIDYVVDDSGASLVIAWHECATHARAVAAERSIPFIEIDPSAREIDSEPAAHFVERSDDDTAVLLYTSGTTGKPKGAELTVANINAVPETFRKTLQTDPDERWATALPLFHIFGQAVVMHTALSVGHSLSLLSPFSPTEFMNRLRDEHITIACGVPTMWNAMLQSGDGYGPDDFSDLRLACSGGAPIPGEVIRAFAEKFGAAILEGYGLTETAGSATFRNLTGKPKVGTVGPALPEFTIEVRDPDGAVLPPDTVGEIYISGPTVMKGYWNRPDATASDLRDGWLKTGDLGSIDIDGDVKIVDRAKDLIIRGGYNVYPREVEEVLYTHPDIVEVAVIGVPDPHYGEEIAAVIAPRPGAQIDVADLRTWTKQYLSAYKVPRVVQFVDALPKGATGKILKRAIDREALSALAR